MTEQIKSRIDEIINNFSQLYDYAGNDINSSAKEIINSIQLSSKIMFCGNGGSAADSQHLSAELLGRYRINREALPAIALTTDTSTITAIGNDFSFSEIFSRQVSAIGKEGDVLYAISTSGNSENIIKAIEAAKIKKIKTIGLTGSSGGKLLNLCDILIKVPAERPDRIQEMHIAVGQIICEIVENYFFVEKNS